MEHLESKYTQDEPVDIDTELELLNSDPDLAKGLEAHFQMIQRVKERMKDTNEPVSETTMKRIIRGKLKRIPHMQDAMNDWDDMDKGNNKTYVEFQTYCIAEDLKKVKDQNILSKIGIANSVEQVEDPRMQAMENNMLKMIEAMNVLSAKVQESEKENEKPKAKESDAQTNLIAQLLASNQQCLAAVQNNNSDNNSNSSNSNGDGKPYKWVKKEVTWNKYCSSCGVTCDHENDDCTSKQSWHKAGATYDDKKGGNTRNSHMWGKKTKKNFKVRNN